MNCIHKKKCCTFQSKIRALFCRIRALLGTWIFRGFRRLSQFPMRASHVPLLLLQVFFESSHALSSYLTQPYWCDELDLTNVGGVDIMGYPLKLDEHQNTVKISREDGTVLDDGATYVAGETLTVTMSTETISASRAHQFVFEVHGPAAFAKGPRTGCGGRRATTNVTSLHVAPTGDTPGPIRVFAAWSKGSSGVHESACWKQVCRPGRNGSAVVC